MGWEIRDSHGAQPNPTPDFKLWLPDALPISPSAHDFEFQQMAAASGVPDTLPVRGKAASPLSEAAIERALKVFR